MKKHLPTFWPHIEKLPPSLFNPGAGLWIVIGAAVGFFAATGTMDMWVVELFSDETAAFVFVPVIIIAVAAMGMAFGIALHRAWDHKRMLGRRVSGGGEELEPVSPKRT